MFGRLAILLVIGFIVGCLGAMGVGEEAMLKLIVALCVMTFTAVFIAWIFLRNHAAPDDP